MLIMHVILPCMIEFQGEGVVLDALNLVFDATSSSSGIEQPHPADMRTAMLASAGVAAYRNLVEAVSIEQLDRGAADADVGAMLGLSRSRSWESASHSQLEFAIDILRYLRNFVETVNGDAPARMMALSLALSALQGLHGDVPLAGMVLHTPVSGLDGRPELIATMIETGRIGSANKAVRHAVRTFGGEREVPPEILSDAPQDAGEGNVSGRATKRVDSIPNASSSNADTAQIERGTPTGRREPFEQPMLHPESNTVGATATSAEGVTDSSASDELSEDDPNFYETRDQIMDRLRVLRDANKGDWLALAEASGLSAVGLHQWTVGSIPGRDTMSAAALSDFDPQLATLISQLPAVIPRHPRGSERNEIGSGGALPPVTSVSETAEIEVTPTDDPRTVIAILAASEVVLSEVSKHLHSGVWDSEPALRIDIENTMKALRDELTRPTGDPPDRNVATALTARLRTRLLSLVHGPNIDRASDELLGLLENLDEHNLDETWARLIQAADWLSAAASWDAGPPKWLNETTGWEEFAPLAGESPGWVAAAALGLTTRLVELENLLIQADISEVAQRTSLLSTAVTTTVAAGAIVVGGVEVTTAAGAAVIVNGVVTSVISSIIWTIRAFLRRKHD